MPLPGTCRQRDTVEYADAADDTRSTTTAAQDQTTTTISETTEPTAPGETTTAVPETTLPGEQNVAGPRNEQVMKNGPVPEELMARIVADVSERTGATQSELTVVRAESALWKDGSPGCPISGHSYTQALVDGYWVVIGTTEQSSTTGHRNPGPSVSARAVVRRRRTRPTDTPRTREDAPDDCSRADDCGPAGKRWAQVSASGAIYRVSGTGRRSATVSNR